MDKKILIGSIITVVILILVSSSSAVEYKADDIKVIYETDDDKVEPLDNGYYEIITYVDGIVWPLQIKWWGILINLRLEMWEKGLGSISIKAYTLNPLNPVYDTDFASDFELSF